LTKLFANLLARLMMSLSMSLPSSDTLKLAISTVMVLAKAAPCLKINQVDPVQVGGNLTHVVYGMRASVIIRLPRASSGIFAKVAGAHIAKPPALARRVQRLEVGANAALTCSIGRKERWCPGVPTVYLRSSRGVEFMSFYLSCEALLRCSAINLACVSSNTALCWLKPPRVTLGAAKK
jgi:hypothetical protein